MQDNQDDKQEKKNRLYPTMAISYAINLACCTYTITILLRKNYLGIAFGIGIIAIESLVGLLRYGYCPQKVCKLH